MIAIANNLWMYLFEQHYLQGGGHPVIGTPTYYIYGF